MISLFLLSFAQYFNASKFEGRNFYQLTGLDPTSKPRDIQKAYELFIRQQKRNLNPSQHTKDVWELTETAFNILSNEYSKALYDLMGINMLNLTRFQIAGYQSDEALEALKKMIGQVPQEMTNYGGMIYYPVQFTLKDFMVGATRTVTSIRSSECECPLGNKDCDKCRENPIVDSATQDEIELPPGAPEFHRMVGRGLGDTALGRGASDVIFIAQAKKDPIFTRDGRNLRASVNVSFIDVLKNKTITLQGLDGEPLNIPVGGLNSGDEYVIKGRGFPDFILPKLRGNVIVKIHVSFPREVTAEQKAVLDEVLGTKAPGNSEL